MVHKKTKEEDIIAVKFVFLTRLICLERGVQSLVENDRRTTNESQMS